MKLDFLDDVSSDGFASKMIRISFFDSAEIRWLITHLQMLMSSSVSRLQTADLAFITSENCSIEFTLSKQGKGLYQLSDGLFVCDLTKPDYERLIGLIRPFESSLAKPLFLLEPKNGIELLISLGGGW